MSTSLYEGNALFRNEPSYKIFNKSFENADDSFFTLLNEVDSKILKEEEQAPSQVFQKYTCEFSQVDPRTNKIIVRKVYDHTTDLLEYTFPNSQKRASVINRSQQAACLRVLLAWQRKSTPDDGDYKIWCANEKKRCDEQQRFHISIYDYATADKLRLYAPMKPLVQQYSKLYQYKTQRILSMLPDVPYTTQTGLPLISKCISQIVEVAHMEELQLLCRVGEVRMCLDVRLHQRELRSLRVCLERYTCPYETDDTVSQRIAKQLDAQIMDATEDVFVLPLDAMLMLLTPSDYVDLPTSLILNISEIADSQFKRFEFQQPFPANKCGWHTNSQVLAHAYAAYTSDIWLTFGPDGKILPVNDKPDKKNDANNHQMPKEFKLHPIAETTNQLKTNSALVSWRLCTVNKEDSKAGASFQVYSSLPVPAVHDNLIGQPLGCHLIKLETKPECGCEIMTKYELLSAWLQLRLLQTNYGHCSRISLRDFEPLLEEPLTLSELEKQLKECYCINMPQLLCNLYEFLKLLFQIPLGEYLLRYSSKYNTQFLLCSSKLEPTNKSVKIKDLLTAIPPTDIDFLNEGQSYLSISPTLCSRLHEEKEVLPCAFPPNEKSARCPKAKPIATPKRGPVQRTVRPKTPAPKRIRKRVIQRKRTQEAAKKKKEEEDNLDKIMYL